MKKKKKFFLKIKKKINKKITWNIEWNKNVVNILMAIDVEKIKKKKEFFFYMLLCDSLDNRFSVFLKLKRVQSPGANYGR